MRIAATLLFIALSTGVVQANTAAADACKAELTPVGKEIYTATIAQNPTKATARAIVTKEVKGLIEKGTVSISQGREAGKAVGHCLEKLTE